MSQQKISIVVAMAKDNRAIGIDNALPWHLPEDLQHFKAVTSGKPIIMGRNTWLSIGRPLPKRRNMVISRDIFYKAEGAEVFHSLFEALATCLKEPEVCIIGGANVYKQAIHLATDLYLTEVDAQVEGDTFFPEFDLNEWQAVSKEERLAKNGTRFAFMHYQRQMDTP